MQAPPKLTFYIAYALYYIVFIINGIHAQDDVADKINIRIYRNGVNTQYEEFLIKNGVEALSMSPLFNTTKPLVLIIHGAGQGAQRRLIREIVDSFGKSGKSQYYNVLATHLPEVFKNDWETKFYFGSVPKSEVAGIIIGDFLRDLIRVGMTQPRFINLVGYCMGAHTAGYVARRVATEYRAPVEYIAGIDPGGVGYEALFKTKTLTNKDARVVHQFHTYFYYLSSNPGTADFVFNNGFLQRGCLGDRMFCSHARAVWLFTEAVVNGKGFQGRRCSSYTAFQMCRCNDQETKFVSFPPDDSASGYYYLTTNSRSPYGMGEAGSVCPITATWKYYFSYPGPTTAHKEDEDSQIISDLDNID